jgi:hypothetical protein
MGGRRGGYAGTRASAQDACMRRILIRWRMHDRPARDASVCAVANPSYYRIGEARRAHPGAQKMAGRRAMETVVAATKTTAVAPTVIVGGDDAVRHGGACSRHWDTGVFALDGKDRGAASEEGKGRRWHRSATATFTVPGRCRARARRVGRREAPLLSGEGVQVQ